MLNTFHQKKSTNRQNKKNVWNEYAYSMRDGQYTDPQSTDYPNELP